MVRGVAAALVVSLLLAGCSSRSSNGAATDMSGSSSMAYTQSATGGFASPNAPAESMESGVTEGESLQTDRKIVKNVDLRLETMDFDQAIQEIETLITQSGGYVEQSNIDGKSIYSNSETYERSATFTARIPAEKLDEVVSSVGSLCNITSQNDTIQDITDSYFDTEARLETLQVQEERLLELLRNAQTMEDMITLESALSEVRYQIESYTSSLRRMDNQVSYSYLDIYLREVVEYNVVQSQPKTFGQKLKQAFIRSGENISSTLSGLLFFLIEDGPVLLINLALILVIVLLARKLFARVIIPAWRKNRPPEAPHPTGIHYGGGWSAPMSPPVAKPDIQEPEPHKNNPSDNQK